MTKEDSAFLERINNYADEVLDGIDPQKTQVGFMLEKLKPVMEEIASETGESIESVFIRYMDLASEANVDADKQFRDKFGEDDVLDLPIK